MKKNILSVAIVIAGLIIAGTIIYVNPQSQREEDINVLSVEESELKVMDFINNIMLQGQMTASFSSISEEYGLYKVDILLEGRPYSSYMTKDGKMFFPEAVNIDELTELMKSNSETPTEIEQEKTEEEEPGAIAPTEDVLALVSCLKDKDFVIYGADWCPFCTKLLDMFGGKDVAEPIYVECTEQESLCKEKEISGYPTILVNNKKYEGTRSLEGFALATGCSL